MGTLLEGPVVGEVVQWSSAGACGMMGWKGDVENGVAAYAD